MTRLKNPWKFKNQFSSNQFNKQSKFKNHGIKRTRTNQSVQT